MERTNELRNFYDKNKTELDKSFEFEKHSLFKKIKEMHEDWTIDDVKFNMYLLIVNMMAYIHDDNNFSHVTDNISTFGIDELD